jgi:hypothetical protein
MMRLQPGTASMNVDLFSTVYVSAATREQTAAQLEQLLQESRGRNVATEITGVLLYCNGNFMQVLEGPRPAVQETFQRIEFSTRHRELVELVSEPIETREFSQWSMAFSRTQASQFLALRAATWRGSAAGGHASRAGTGRDLLRQFWHSTR